MSRTWASVRAAQRQSSSLTSTIERRAKAAPAWANGTRARSLGTFQIPKVNNEPNLAGVNPFVQQHYLPGTAEREGLEHALKKWKNRGTVNVPAVIGGLEITSGANNLQANPSEHAHKVAAFPFASADKVQQAIDAALSAKTAWENLPFADRAAVFLKAADLIGSKYRYDIMATTMLGQGKNAWQAEIDSAAELCDFLRFNVAYAEQLYAQQPQHNAANVWNRLEYRGLEGFVYAISPFNFTAIGGNLPCAPALMGNVVLWKPSPHAMLSNHLLYSILLEAGLPPNVIQFVPGDAEQVTSVVLNHPEFAGLHYTGSTAVFRQLYGKIGAGVAAGTFKGYPRIVGETGGKNFHLLHPSADVENAALQTVRGAFEYAGQKCSATSRVYVPKSLAAPFIDRLIKETEALKQGPVDDFTNFLGPVIHAGSFNKLRGVIDQAQQDSSVSLLAGGQYDDSKGYFMRPTVLQVDNSDHSLLRTEFFGPILAVHVYDDGHQTSGADYFAEACRTVATSSEYALTGSVFAQDRYAVRQAEEQLRDAAGNFYINTKSTGAVVGQQPFGGARASGTNDKAGSASLLSRFVSMRAIKEEFVPISGVTYPSNGA